MPNSQNAVESLASRLIIKGKGSLKKSSQGAEGRPIRAYKCIEVDFEGSFINSHRD